MSIYAFTPEDLEGLLVEIRAAHDALSSGKSVDLPGFDPEAFPTREACIQALDGVATDLSATLRSDNGAFQGDPSLITDLLDARGLQADLPEFAATMRYGKGMSSARLLAATDTALDRLARIDAQVRAGDIPVDAGVLVGLFASIAPEMPVPMVCLCASAHLARVAREIDTAWSEGVDIPELIARCVLDPLLREHGDGPRLC